MPSAKYVGIRTFMGAEHCRADQVRSGSIVFTGAPLDAGQTFRVGARLAPAAIRESSRHLRPYNPRLAIDLDRLDLLDAGDADVTPTGIEDGFRAIREHIATIATRGGRPIIMGGDCSIAYPVLEALHALHGPLALVHLDAHTDTWDEYWGTKFTHGTPVRRAVEAGFIDPGTSIQIGMRGSGYGPDDVQQSRELGLTVITADEVHTMGVEAVHEQVRARVGDRPVLLHFDIDCLDPAFAPGTGLPEVGGLSTHQAVTLLAGMAGIRIVAGEVTEVLPAYDPSGITSIAAANILFELASLVGAHDER